jgi:hypothetical protein
MPSYQISGYVAKMAMSLDSSSFLWWFASSGGGGAFRYFGLGKISKHASLVFSRRR